MSILKEINHSRLAATRTEHDSMGDVQVPKNRYWGAHTERSRNNFEIELKASMPQEIITSAKISHLVLLPQGKLESVYSVIKLVGQIDAEGFGNCSNTEACEVECPQEISVLHIGRMNYEYNKALALRK